MLEMVSLSYRGGDQAQMRHDEMLNEYFSLVGIDRRGRQIEASWAALKMKKRG